MTHLAVKEISYDLIMIAQLVERSNQVRHGFISRLENVRYIIIILLNILGYIYVIKLHFNN